MILSECIDVFLRRCRVMALSDVTYKNYVHRLGLFCDFIFHDLDINSLTRQHIEDYALHLLSKNKENLFVTYNKKISKYTVRSYLIDVRTFLNYLYHEKILLDNLAQYIVIPKTSKKQVLIYSDEQIQAIFNCFKYSSSQIEYRNYCIVALMYDSGLRRQEVCNLTLNDLDFVNHVLLVHGKGDKSRFVPLGEFSSSLISRYLTLRPDCSVSSLFVSSMCSPLTGNAIENIFYRIRKKVSFPVSAHRLRHNFATNFLLDQYEKQGFADVYQLQVVLGHESTETTMKYLHIANGIIASRTRNSRLDRKNFDVGF